MAAFDISLLWYFRRLFIFLFVFLVVYAILQKLEILSEEKGINAIVALAIGVIAIFSGDFADLLVFMVPWYVILFVFILFILVAFQFAGVPKETVVDMMKGEWGTAHWIILALIAIVLLGSISAIYGPRLAAKQPILITPGVGDNVTVAPGAYESKVTDIIFNPKIIGVFVLMLIITFAIRTLIYEAPKEEK